MSDELDAIKQRMSGPIWPNPRKDTAWLIAKVEQLRESNRDWRHTADVAAQKAQRTVGLEAAASSAFDEVERLRGELTRLRGLLKRLQWEGTHCEHGREYAACPVCDVLADSPAIGQQPHAPDCWLAAELSLASAAGGVDS